jgi:hypothetical protein
MKPLSYSQLGQALGISKQAVGKLAQAGMPTNTVEAAQQWRLANLDASRSKDARMGIGAGQGDRRPSAGADDPDDDAPATDDSAEYRQARTQREQIRRDREALQLEQERGRLVDVEEVARLRFTEFRALRDALGNVGARIAAAVATKDDPLSCEQLIQDEIEAALQAFADNVLTRGVTQDDDDDADHEEPD